MFSLVPVFLSGTLSVLVNSVVHVSYYRSNPTCLCMDTFKINVQPACSKIE